MRIRNICILGGTGFVGRHLANRLSTAQEKRHTRVLTRHRERNKHLLVIPNLYLYEVDHLDEDSLAYYFKGCEIVINLIGILNESRKGDFERVHAQLPERIARACKRAGVKRLLHMSALGASAEAPSAYQRSKAEGERRVHEAANDVFTVTSFQPSVIFGPEDSFFNRFAGLLRISPGIFPLPTPDARFSPVYVGDVATPLSAACSSPAAMVVGTNSAAPKPIACENW
ncbi:complex I NDUFA9 subunit family protein [Alkalilimnicola ehrlichii]|uniref:complex I NDUFA9 subunit family protein n=1 Tax=Alkalilimnicola ehrlichii TaxID=351052 RepID=UPI00267C83E1|nr:complex I NDUFA9 subunit family protein [Alkalilimnicola ehrlichii]